MSSPVPPSDPGQGGTEDASPIPPITPPPAPARLGASTFTIEGRAAPALFVIGWLATLLGFGLIVIALMSGDPAAGRILVIVGIAILSIGLVAAAGSQGIERRVRGVLPYQGPSPFLVLLAAIPISVLALVVVSVPLALLGISLDGPFAALVSVTLQAGVYIGLVRLLVVDTGALDWVSMGIRRFDRTAVLEMFGGALWAAPLVVITGIVASILVNLVPVEPVSPLPPTGTTSGLIVSLVAGALVAPFGEEILFRGFATTAWVRGRGIRGGVILGALVFAFAHVVTISGTTAGEAFQQAFVAFAGRIPIAIALGVLFVRRGTIWASFGLHAAFNAILLVLAELLSRSI
ncbi:MAG TPA: type II CAAX endopeptidase family protein [Candidatus Limnocylindrales bacterium]